MNKAHNVFMKIKPLVCY